MMKYAALVLSLLTCLAAVDALACAQCKYDSSGCPECQETPWDGGDYCRIFDGAGGQTCLERGICSGWGGPEPCNGSPCSPWPFLVERRVPENRAWRLVSHTFVPAKPAKALKRL